MMSDVLGSPVAVPNTIEGSGAGAALLGMLAVGEIRDFSSVHNWVQVRHTLQTDLKAFEVYRQLTTIYSRVYHQLKDEFDAIAAFQQQHTLS